MLLQIHLFLYQLFMNDPCLIIFKGGSTDGWYV